MSWREDLNYGLAAFGLQIPERVPLDEWASALSGGSLRGSAAVVGVSAVLFYLAERNHNSKVNDLWDAMVYTSTCLSVGYGDIFAKTPLGKILGSALMTYGPNLVSNTLEARDTAEGETVQREMLDTLRQILARLESASELAGDNSTPSGTS
jgi:hypothetical protein